MCTEANRNYPFPGYIDISSLVVQDDYIFIQVRLCTVKQSAVYETLCMIKYLGRHAPHDTNDRIFPSLVTPEPVFCECRKAHKKAIMKRIQDIKM